MGVLPVNMPQKGGGLLRFVMVSSQIPTLARGGGVGISIDKCIMLLYLVQLESSRISEETVHRRGPQMKIAK